METEKIPVAEHLGDREYKLFLRVYANHSRYMNVNERSEYTLSEVENVIPCLGDECLKVYFTNGTCWHYAANGKWKFIR